MMEFQTKEKHEVEGVTLLEKMMNESVAISDAMHKLDVGTLMVADYREYDFIALPGPDVVDKGRAEHEPLHFHVRVHGNYNPREVRIRISDFEEYDGIFIPRTLRRFLKDKDVRSYLARNTASVYKTGKPADKQRPNFNIQGLYKDKGQRDEDVKTTMVLPPRL
jgi:hypothetical protein